MSYQLTISQKPGYLHCTVTGANTIPNIMAYLEEVMREAEARGAGYVLIEERLTGRRLETWDVYEVASASGKFSGVRLKAVAYVDVNAQGELMKFAETVANNRGLPMTVFATIAEAEAWLAARAQP